MVEQLVKAHYNFLIIGAGSGAMGAGRRAAMFGQKVAMIENKKIGGTCVNVGCVPKKVMYNLANFIEDAHVVKDYGLDGLDNLKLDFPQFVRNREAYIKRLNDIYTNNLKNANIDYITGTARFISPKEVEVNNGEDQPVERYSADHILIASGSYPENGEFEGKEHCWSSDDVFAANELPKEIIVIGGGYIAVEMSQIMQAFGVKTTLLVRETVLRVVDKDVTDLLLENMKKLGLDVKLNTPFKRVSKNQENGLLCVETETGEQFHAEKVLVAIGRPQLLQGLNLEAAGVEIEKGAVKVDENHFTNVPGIYAIGDVTKHIQLTPVAIKAGRILSEYLFNERKDLRMNYDNIPTVIFSHPPIGYVGLSEQQARKEFGDKVKVYKSKFVNMFYSLAKDDQKKLNTLMKLICVVQEDGQEKIVGCHCIGRNIDEMMQIISVTLNMGATKKDYDSTVAIHPTASEEFVLMDPKLY
eukprot:403375964